MNIAVILAFFTSLCFASGEYDTQSIVREMDLAYGKVETYRMEVEVTKPAENGAWVQQRFTYAYKKPHHVRIDFHEPHKGTVAVYPDEQGKVHVRPWGLRFFDLHLNPDSILLGDPSGQRVDQTDLGLLISNISGSMTEGRRGRLEISENGDSVVVSVLAEDHFRKSVDTFYIFVIDKKSWLPREVREHTPDGSLKRRTVFSDLKINLDISDNLFRLNGE